MANVQSGGSTIPKWMQKVNSKPKYTSAGSRRRVDEMAPGAPASGSWFNPNTGKFSTPSTRFGEQMDTLTGKTQFNNAIPQWVQESRFRNTLNATPSAPGYAPTMPNWYQASRVQSGPAAYDVPTVQQYTAEKERRRQVAIEGQNFARDRRQQLAAEYSPEGLAGVDVGNIEIGNQIGDYIRSLDVLPPPPDLPDGGGGKDWWGGSRRRGGGYSSGGYGDYVPNWYTGLFSLNANR